jgi:hypothetical protein
MGTTISMDVSACVPTTPTTTLEFEDALRQEVILVPEDLADIHIEAPPSTTDATDDHDPAIHNRYGKGKHWKRNLKKKQVAAPVQTERTIEERRQQVRPIIDRLIELQMNVSYPAIRELYKQLSQFIKTGEDTKIKIPFPEFSRKIKGELSNAPYIPCWVKLEME